MMPSLQALTLCVASCLLPRSCSCFVSNTWRPRPLVTPLSSNHNDNGGAITKKWEEEEERSRQRRRIILSAPAAILLLPSNNNAANAAETAAESIRLLSAKTIPGLGPPDVYYPPYFVGRWRVTRIVASSDDNFWNDLKRRGVDLPVQFVSEMRFVPYDAGKDFAGSLDDNPNNADDVPAIADRSFNERSYRSSLSDELNRLYSTTKPIMSPVRSLDWTPTNPNVLSLSYSDGSSEEIKVTKRSSDVSQDGGGVFSTEFRRVTTVPPSSVGSVAGGIPSISKSRVLAKWKRNSDGTAAKADGGVVNLIEGIEILYNEQGTLGERDANPSSGKGRNELMEALYTPGSGDLPSWRSTKTKILMERITG